MFTIRIVDLEVFYRVGVTEEERSEPQRLMVTVEMEVDAAQAVATDGLEDTIDYYSVSQDLLNYSKARSWKLLEKVCSELSDMILAKYDPHTVRVEIKKFIIPEARHVSVSCSRSSGSG